jgi:hypothetical protein
MDDLIDGIGMILCVVSAALVVAALVHLALALQ